METLRRPHAFPPKTAEAMAGWDVDRFGEVTDIAWKLNVDLEPERTTPRNRGGWGEDCALPAGSEAIGRGRRRVPADGVQVGGGYGLPVP